MKTLIREWTLIVELTVYSLPYVTFAFIFSYLKFDTIKLIKTRPGSRLSQAFKKFSHCLVIQTIRTIENDALTKMY